MIRIILGLLLIMGAVGNIDYDPTASVMNSCIIALTGGIIMAYGVRKITK